MKIGLLGYGAMGKIICEMAKERGHEVVSIVDINKGIVTSDADCYIDFSVSSAFKKNIQKVCNFSIPIVIGTTGWYDDFQKYEALLKETNTKGIWGSNFSLGVNIFMSIVEESSSLMNTYMKEYDVLTHEFHHKNKVDSPSGTAIKIASLINEKIKNKNTLQYEKLERKPKAEEIHVTSSRGGDFPGTHQVFFDSSFDTIELTHRARTRTGFALGAIIAAENISSAPIGLSDFYTFFKTMYT